MRHHVPAPTIWPAALATGVTLFAAGLVTSPIVLAFGALLAVASLVGWIGILLTETSER